MSSRTLPCQVVATSRDRSPLSWPQQHIWRVIEAIPGTPSYGDLYLTVVPPADAKVSPDAAVSALARLVARHEALRTTMGTAGGDLGQDVIGRIEVPVAVYGPDERAAPWRLVPQGDGLPLGAAVLVGDGGTLDRMMVRVDHRNADEWGLRLLESQLSAELRGTADTTVPVQPADVVAWERSAGGQAAQRAAEEHVRRQLTDGPATMFPYRHEPRSPRYWVGRLRSPALAAALALLGRRRLTPAGVINAAFSVEVAAWAGTSAALLYAIATNRHDPRWRGYAGPMVQEVPLLVDVRHRNLGELAARASAATLEAYRHAHADPVRFDAVVADVEVTRGRVDRMGRAVVVNFHQAGRGRTNHDRLAVLRRGTRFAWVARTDAENLGLLLDATVAATEATLSLRLDTSLATPEEGEAMLRGVEDRILALAEADAAVRS